jgi:hypothetical protein
MNSFQPSWVSCAVNSVGNSGGLLVTWDPNKFDLVPYLSCGGILLTGWCIESKREITLLNIYGPCSERKRFWNKVAECGLLSHKNLVIVGDLNFTFRRVRSGGVGPSRSLGRFFQIFFTIK